MYCVNYISSVSTCVAILQMPSVKYDSVCLLSFHISCCGVRKIKRIRCCKLCVSFPFCVW